jgi:demethylmenaquinone methyltransferase / 2-methoxy-6-polyprenyl-1,4-benzoquinol methylase
MSQLPQGREKVQAIRSMFDRIAPRYDLVNRVITFGMDVGWRRRTIDALALPRDSLVLDVACGTGDLGCEMRARNLRPIGLDMSWGMLAAARDCAPLVQGDALTLPVRDTVCDGVACGFALRNVADLSELFSEFARVVRGGGRIALLEVAEPGDAVRRAIHRAYFRHAVPVIGGVLSDKDAYSYLPRSTEYLPPIHELLDMLRAAGFNDVRRQTAGFGAAQVISATRSI